jgi:hypothetical protein
MKVMTKLIGIAILTTAISAPAFAQMYETPYGRTVATAPARVHARTISRQYDQQSYAMSPPQAGRHLWRILELRQYWRRQPGLQRNAAQLVGLDQRQRGRTGAAPFCFFLSSFRAQRPT